MSNEIIDISRYRFKQKHRLFLDANIWIFVYGPVFEPENPKKSIYSQALKNMMKSKSIILIEVLIVLEFINRYARMKYKIIEEQFCEKKFQEISPERRF